MAPTDRTYKHLSTGLAAMLLLQIMLPVVQVACAAVPNAMAANMPAHSSIHMQHHATGVVNASRTATDPCYHETHDNKQLECCRLTPIQPDETVLPVSTPQIDRFLVAVGDLLFPEPVDARPTAYPEGASISPPTVSLQILFSSFLI